MRNWIAFVAQHHNIEVLSENSIKIPNIGYDEDGRTVYHIVTRCGDHYTVSEYYTDTNAHTLTWQENSIKEYLGY